MSKTKIIGLGVLALFVLVIVFNHEGLVQEPAEPEGGTATVNETEKFAMYEIEEYNLSFQYPKNSYIETKELDESGLFLRIQENTEDDTVDRFGLKSLKYFISFINDDSAIYLQDDTWLENCLSNIPDYKTITLDQITAYKGTTIPDKSSGVGGGDISVCLEVKGKGLNIIGQDYSGENIFENILKSIEATD